jgi:uncharacterized protein YjbI with pentapeptide repeats/energy-coupling factor transporter ATP-binding protein EcfA2
MKPGARRAPVKPRVLLSDGEIVPFESELDSLISRAQTGAIALVGPPGSGKSTALAHIACFLAPDAGVQLLDGTPPLIVKQFMQKSLVIYTATRPYNFEHVAVLSMARWTVDDCIEYLMAEHPEQCASVMKRMSAAKGLEFLEGLPELCRVVLDQFARDETIIKFSFAIEQWIMDRLDVSQIRQAQRACLVSVLTEPNTIQRTAKLLRREKVPETGLDTEASKILEKSGCDKQVLRLLKHMQVQYLFARNHILADINAQENCPYLYVRMPRGFVRLLGSALASDDRAAAHLKTLCAKSLLQAMASSILHFAGRNWEVPPGVSIELAGAYLNHAIWPGVNLRNAQLAEIDLSFSDLSGAHLASANLAGANFRRAILKEANLEGAMLPQANFSAADLRGANGSRANFSGVNLENADLTDGNFKNARFCDARMIRAKFTGADMAGADLQYAKMTEADFADCDLSGADLTRQVMRLANFRGAKFKRAQMFKCDLEYMELPGADFQEAVLANSNLTGSFIPAGNFGSATLCNAGLAEIQWERADLRGANMTGVTFHMGSTRAGMIFSPIASEGSRTGFYTDDYYDQGFKAPEAIRKANLRGADLRGAKIEGVDFYLVDLRDARYDEKQHELLRQSGAILESRA